MPASIEVVEPSNMKINCKEASEILSALTERLHKYDNIVRQAEGRIKFLTKELEVAIKILEGNGLVKDGKLTKEAVKGIKKK